jgi:hypothetical protein
MRNTFKTFTNDYNVCIYIHSHSSHLRSPAIALSRSSRLPSSQRLFTLLSTRESVLLIKTTGVLLLITLARKAKGNTTSEVPMIMTRSASATQSKASANSLGSPSPKNTTSGFIRPLHSHFMTFWSWIACFHVSVMPSFLQSMHRTVRVCP